MLKRSLHFVFALVLLSACAVEFEGTETSLSEDEAFGVLKSVPLREGMRSIHGKTSRLSSQQVTEVLSDLVKSGRLESNPKVADLLATGNVNLGTLEDIFALLQGGSVNSIWGLVQGLLALDPGQGSGTSSSLDSILALINAAMPLIAAFAPQFVPILQAIIVIAPVIIRFIEMIKGKSKRAVFSAGPQFATLFGSHAALMPMRA